MSIYILMFIIIQLDYHYNKKSFISNNSKEGGYIREEKTSMYIHILLYNMFSHIVIRYVNDVYSYCHIICEWYISTHCHTISDRYIYASYNYTIYQ